MKRPKINMSFSLNRPNDANLTILSYSLKTPGNDDVRTILRHTSWLYSGWQRDINAPQIFCIHKCNIDHHLLRSVCNFVGSWYFILSNSILNPKLFFNSSTAADGLYKPLLSDYINQTTKVFKIQISSSLAVLILTLPH